MRFGRKAFTLAAIVVGFMLATMSGAAARLRPLQNWTAPDGTTFQLGIEDEDVSGFGPEAMRPVVLDSNKIVAVGPWTFGALVRCPEPNRCGFLLSTWLPVKAEPDQSAFRPGQEQADDHAEYGFAYKPMSPADWLAAFREFAGMFPIFFWSEVGLGVLGAALVEWLGRIQRQGQRGSMWLVGAIDTVATAVWIAALSGLLLVSLYLFAFMGPTWFAFVAAYASFSLPCAMTWLVLKGVSGMFTRQCSSPAA